MKKIDLYKTDKGKEKVKTINEIADELEKRLESQGLKPDFSLLSPDFKKIKGNSFPLNNYISGMLSVNNDMVTASLNVKDNENEDIKGRMFTVQYKMQEGRTAEAFEKAAASLRVMMESFWINVEEGQLSLVNEVDQEQLKGNSTSKQDTKQIVKSGNVEEVAKSIQKALADPDVAKAYESLQKTAGSEKTEQKSNDDTKASESNELRNYQNFEPFIKYMDKKIVENYMNMRPNELNKDNVRIYNYKNVMNREYIHLDENGNFYDHGGNKISREEALATVKEPMASSVALGIPIDEIDVKASPELIKMQKAELEYMKKLSEQDQQSQKTITISTGAKSLTDEKIVSRYQKSAGQGNSSGDSVNRESGSQNISGNSSLKDQLIKVDFTPEQAEVVIQLLEENQKKYEPKSSMFALLGNTLGKMVHALGQKLEELLDAEKVINEKLDSIYSAINNEDYDKFKERFGGFDQKIKYCHDLISEAAQGRSIQSTNIINRILNQEKVPVSIRTLHNAFSVAIDNNIESALTLYKYADENLHGEAHAETMRGFINYALDALPEDTAERFIKASSSRTFDDTTLLKETIRAGKYNLVNSCLKRCENIDELAPSLFYFSAQRRDADAMHILKNIGTDINANHGEALYVCFEENKLDTAKLLINYGADIESLDKRINQIMKTNSANLTDDNFDFLNQLYDHCNFNSKTESNNEEMPSEEQGG